MDNHTPEQRSKNMKAIRSKDTSIEVALRKELWSRGVRYRKNVNGMVGHPDLVFKGKKVVVFCDSEFWHGFDWENRREKIQSNREYWIPKIERNMQRDAEITAYYEENGWVVLRFWGNQIKKDCQGCADLVCKKIQN